MPSKENLGYYCVKSGGPGIWITLERFAQGVQGLELYRKEANLSIAAFTRKLPITRSTYYGWLGGRKPDRIRIVECFAVAAKL
jgi:hypothetical protein